mmetsp:Transcript_10274/g.29312  ORF Transcript_10274/g.29312 Transcript_10274/m.29312 type:complete len:247 (+) Transcript_10274:156-896(+)
MRSCLGIGFGFRAPSSTPLQASARTKSPLNAPIRFNVRNTSSTVDRGFSKSASRSGDLSPPPRLFEASVLYRSVDGFHKDGGQPPDASMHAIIPGLGRDGEPIAGWCIPDIGANVLKSDTGNTRVGSFKVIAAVRQSHTLSLVPLVGCPSVELTLPICVDSALPLFSNRRSRCLRMNCISCFAVIGVATCAPWTGKADTMLDTYFLLDGRSHLFKASAIGNRTPRNALTKRSTAEQMSCVVAWGCP